MENLKQRGPAEPRGEEALNRDHQLLAADGDTHERVLGDDDAVVVGEDVLVRRRGRRSVELALRRGVVGRALDEVARDIHRAGQRDVEARVADNGAGIRGHHVQHDRAGSAWVGRSQREVGHLDARATGVGWVQEAHGQAIVGQHAHDWRRVEAESRAEVELAHRLVQHVAAAERRGARDGRELDERHRQRVVVGRVEVAQRHDGLRDLGRVHVVRRAHSGVTGLRLLGQLAVGDASREEAEPHGAHVRGRRAVAGGGGRLHVPGHGHRVARVEDGLRRAERRGRGAVGVAELETVREGDGSVGRDRAHHDTLVVRAHEVRLVVHECEARVGHARHEVGPRGVVGLEGLVLLHGHAAVADGHGRHPASPRAWPAP
ncbi:hypothetical protein ON010_g4343 [Phytophthora cinnamomi]|nr:hypothetical protein ON010_g4343 [Phytophthora cinnamomi]